MGRAAEDKIRRYPEDVCGNTSPRVAEEWIPKRECVNRSHWSWCISWLPLLQPQENDRPYHCKAVEKLLLCLYELAVCCCIRNLDVINLKNCLIYFSHLCALENSAKTVCSLCRCKYVFKYIHVIHTFTTRTLTNTYSVNIFSIPCTKQKNSCKKTDVLNSIWIALSLHFACVRQKEKKSSVSDRHCGMVKEGIVSSL